MGCFKEEIDIFDDIHKSSSSLLATSGLPSSWRWPGRLFVDFICRGDAVRLLFEFEENLR